MSRIHSTPDFKDDAFTLDVFYRQLKAYVIEQTGLQYYANKDKELNLRLSKRMEHLGIDDYATYLKLLKNVQGGGQELDELIVELTIGETYFLRHIEQFESLKDVVIPQLIERNQQSKRLRIWCAGCSIGAEPYTLAIYLQEHFSRQLQGWDISIKGTDINRKFLERARKGEFDEWALRSTSTAFRQKYFSETPQRNKWTLLPQYRQWVNFQYHNLLKHPYPSLIDGLSVLDLIICRNVLIYFDQETIHKVIDHFEQSLTNEGWMVLGHSENIMGRNHAFHVIQTASCFLYQKKSVSMEDKGPELPSWQIPPQPIIPVAAPVIHNAKESGKEEVKGKNKKTHSHHRPPVPSDRYQELHSFMHQGKFDQALQWAEKFLSQHKTDAHIYFYKALILSQLGNSEVIEKCLQQAIYLNFRFVMAHYLLGTFYEKNGKMEKAKKSFSNVLDLMEKMDDQGHFPEWDHITVKELRSIVNIHLGFH